VSAEQDDPASGKDGAAQKDKAEVVKEVTGRNWASPEIMDTKNVLME
jgi:hypothetical protein